MPKTKYMKPRMWKNNERMKQIIKEHFLNDIIRAWFFDDLNRKIMNRINAKCHR
jgi:hypothetical protein